MKLHSYIMVASLEYHVSLRMKLYSHIMVARFTQSCFIAEENYFLASWLLGLRSCFIADIFSLHVTTIFNHGWPSVYIGYRKVELQR